MDVCIVCVLVCVWWMGESGMILDGIWGGGGGGGKGRERDMGRRGREREIEFYQRRPPERGEEGLNGPNIVLLKEWGRKLLRFACGVWVLGKVVLW